MQRLRVNRIKAFIVFSVLLILVLCTAFFTVSYAKWGGGTGSSTVTANGSVGKFYVEYPNSAALDETATVRRFNASTSEDNGFTYKNYICVSRKNEPGTDDNSICFIEFFLEGNDGTDLSAIEVENVTLKRAATNADGIPTGGYVDIAPRLYNYDPATCRTLADLSHEPSLIEDETLANSVAHYKNGMYCILFFADYDQQYFALDLEIKTKQPANFTVTATASNVNHWQRFEQGYGQPYGFYLGGFINNVWLWDPRRTTKFSGTEITDASTQLSEKQFSDDGGITYYTSQYPTIPIDITLTVNLTASSQVKAYMLGSNGYRYDSDKGGTAPTSGRVAYLLPETICMPDDLKKLFQTNGKVYTDDSFLNLIIPVSGEYTFRFVGSVSWEDNKQLDANAGLLDESSMQTVGNSNYIVEKLYISTSETTATDYTVKFYDAKGGTEYTDYAQTVKFGQTANKPTPDPTNTADDSKKFDGWYNAADDKSYDFTSDVTGNLNLYAKWIGKQYTVTLHNTNTQAGGFAESSVKTDTTGKLTSLPTPSHTVTKYKFDGWYTKDGSSDGDWGSEITTSTVFTNDTPIYAKWSIIQYTVTFDINGLPSGVTVPDAQVVDRGDKATAPTLTLPEGYNVSGWYTEAACTNQFNFSTPITADNTTDGRITLYAKWYCDVGIYANGEFKQALADNGGSYKYKAVNVELQAGDELTFWGYDATNDLHYRLTSNAFIRNSTTTGICPAYGDVTGTGGDITVAKSDIYSFVINDNSWQDDTGIWAYYGGELNVIVDGVYNGATKVKAFGAHTDVNEPTQVKAVDVAVTADDTVLTVKFNGYDRISKIKTDCTVGTFENGIKLDKGIYTFYYNYETNATWINVESGKYIIDFKNNDGTEDTYDTLVTASTGKLAALPTPEPTRDGYYFGGWFPSSANNAAENTKVTTATVFDAHTTVYAKWQYQVTFDANGGTPSDSTMTTAGDGKLTSLPTATRDLHTFNGWFDAATGGTEITTNTVFTSNTTVYAQWTANKIRIVLDTTNITNVDEFDYHVHIWDHDGTALTNADYNNRTLLTYKDGKYQIELTDIKSGIKGIKFTKDQKGTTKEFCSYEYSYTDGTPEAWQFNTLELGQEYSFSPSMTEYKINIRFNNSSSPNAWLFLNFGGKQIHYYDCTTGGSPANITDDMTLVDSNDQLSIMLKPYSDKWDDQTGQIKVGYNSAGGYDINTGWAGSYSYAIIGKNITFS